MGVGLGLSQGSPPWSPSSLFMHLVLYLHFRLFGAKSIFKQQLPKALGPA